VIVLIPLFSLCQIFRLTSIRIFGSVQGYELLVYFMIATWSNLSRHKIKRGIIHVKDFVIISTW